MREQALIIAVDGDDPPAEDGWPGVARVIRHRALDARHGEVVTAPIPGHPSWIHPPRAPVPSTAKPWQEDGLTRASRRRIAKRAVRGGSEGA